MKSLALFAFLLTVTFTPKEEYLSILAKHYKSRFYVVVAQKGQSTSPFITTTYSLHNYYEKIYKGQSITFKKFLVGVFDKQIKIDSTKCDPYSCFPIKRGLLIEKELSKYGIKYIISKYLIKLDDELRNKQLNEQTMRALTKIMFENGYFVGFSDYSGYYVIRNLEWMKIHGAI
nr:hypothetical protein [uncultured Mucilaginibacter sp.]